MAGEQRIIRFSGSVQGVGFRYTACRAADGYEVTGCVRNLPHGQVEVVVEGESSDIDAFLAELRQRMAEYIEQITQQTLPATGKFHGFSVRF